MIIAVCGSTNFYNAMRELTEDLIAAGHRVYLPVRESGSELTAEEKLAYIKAHQANITVSDAILVVNYDKADQPNYIGANTFAEMVIAQYFGKPIFVLNQLPRQAYIHDEIRALGCIELHGDLSKII